VDTGRNYRKNYYRNACRRKY